MTTPDMSDQAPGTNITNDTSEVVELNVGGVYYSTCLETLRKEPDGHLARLFSDSNRNRVLRDAKGKVFIDRDGVLFRYILDYLRNLKLVLPENFHEKDRLRQEAEFFNLPKLVKSISIHHVTHRPLQHVPSLTLENGKDQSTASAELASQSSVFSPASSPKPAELVTAPSSEIGLSPNSVDEKNSTSTYPSPSGTPTAERGPGYITIGYRGTFAFGRDGLADVKFRKLSRIIVCGKVSLCREVFKNTLNESRDPDRGYCDRYSSRFFLKHSFLEMAFDMLQEEGFSLVASCGSGTNSAGEIKAGLDNEEAKWQHYNEFIFERR